MRLARRAARYTAPYVEDAGSHGGAHSTVCDFTVGQPEPAAILGWCRGGRWVGRAKLDGEARDGHAVAPGPRFCGLDIADVRAVGEGLAHHATKRAGTLA